MYYEFVKALNRVSNDPTYEKLTGGPAVSTPDQDMVLEIAFEEDF